LRLFEQFRPEGAMISFVAVVLLSFVTLCLGTYVADCFERHYAAAGLVTDAPPDGADE
jgi:hypothetical protein